MTIDLDRENFEVEVVKSPLPVMVDFWGPQCNPCLALMPAVQKLESEYAGRLKVAKVNAAQNRMLCARLHVFGLPTFLFYKDGAELKRLTGESITQAALAEAIQAALD